MSRGPFGELETNTLKDKKKYEGKEVLVAGSLANRDNPVQVTIWKSEVRCLVYLKDAEVNSVAHYPADSVEIQVRGTIRSVDIPNRQIEIMATESSVVAAN